MHNAPSPLPLPPLTSGTPATRDLFGGPLVCVMNVDDEAIATPVPGGMYNGGGISALPGYTPRIVGSMTQGDFLVIPRELMGICRASVHYLRELEVTTMHPDQLYSLTFEHDKSMIQNVKHTREALGRLMNGAAGRYVLQPFIHSRDVDDLDWPDRVQVFGSYRSSEMLNNKAVAMQALTERGVPTMPGQSVYTPKEANEVFNTLNGKRGIIKLPRSASGHGIYHFRSREEFDILLADPAIAAHLEEGSYLRRGIQNETPISPHNALGLRIEAWMEDIVSSPGIVIRVGETSAEDRFISATDQMLEGTEHFGNIWPLEYDILPMVNQHVRTITEWAREVGYRGILGIDFVIQHTAEGLRAFVVEINGRVTGQTPGALMVHNILGTTTPQNRAWAINNQVVIPKSMPLDDYIAHLRREGIAYDPAKKEGVIVANHATSKYGPKTQVLALGKNRQHLQILLQAANLPSQMHPSF